MTEKQTKPRTTTTRAKVQPKAKVENTTVNEVVEDVKEEVVKVETKKSRRKKADIDKSELIPVRSMVEGVLIYKSKRTGVIYEWENLGDVELVEFGELLTMKSSQSRFFKDGWITIEDDEVVDFLRIKQPQEDIYSVEDLDDILNAEFDELDDLIKPLPQGIKTSLAQRARHLIESNEDLSWNKKKINALNDLLSVDLSLFEYIEK